MLWRINKPVNEQDIMAHSKRLGCLDRSESPSMNDVISINTQGNMEHEGTLK